MWVYLWLPMATSEVKQMYLESVKKQKLMVCSLYKGAKKFCEVCHVNIELLYCQPTST